MALKIQFSNQQSVEMTPASAIARAHHIGTQLRPSCHSFYLTLPFPYFNIQILYMHSPLLIAHGENFEFYFVEEEFGVSESLKLLIAKKCNSWFALSFYTSKKSLGQKKPLQLQVPIHQFPIHTSLHTKNSWCSSFDFCGSSLHFIEWQYHMAKCMFCPQKPIPFYTLRVILFRYM